MSSFNEKHNRFMSGLDQAYEELMSQREREIYEDEVIRDWILKDDALFQRLARQWLDDPTNREGFLDAAVEMVKEERTPQFTRAWAKDPLEVKP